EGAQAELEKKLDALVENHKEWGAEKIHVSQENATAQARLEAVDETLKESAERIAELAKRAEFAPQVLKLEREEFEVEYEKEREVLAQKLREFEAQKKQLDAAEDALEAAEAEKKVACEGLEKL